MPVIAVLLVVCKFAWLASAALLWLLTDLENWAEGTD